MRKVFLCFLFLALIIFVVATLPALFVAILGVIHGSFEMFPRPEDNYRGIYIICTIIIVSVDLAVVRGIIKLFKAIGRK